MALSEGDGVRVKAGKHKGQVGHVHRDLGQRRTYHVMFRGYGLSYQPAQNLDPDHDGDVDAPGGSDPDHDRDSWTVEGWERAMALVLASR